MEQEYLTVKQFAEQSGCTPQRVYQLLRNRLQPFLKYENGVRYIHIDGLKVVEKARVAQGFNKGLTRVAQGFNKSLTRVEDAPDIPEPQPEQSQEQVVDNALQATIDALTTQLAAKDKQINELTAALASMQSILNEMQHTQQTLTDALAVSQKTQQQLADALTAAQALHAGTLQTFIDTQQDDHIVDAPAAEKTPVQEPQSVIPADEPKQDSSVEKKGKIRQSIWVRLFRK